MNKFVAAFKDPIRRRNVCSRIVEGVIGCTTTMGIFTALTILSLQYLTSWSSLGVSVFINLVLSVFIGVMMEFIYYEYIAEPLGWSGHYWERGPRDGETFIYW